MTKQRECDVERLYSDMHMCARKAINLGGCPDCIARAHVKVLIGIVEEMGDDPIAWLENILGDLRASVERAN
jgi:hypothetical protein